MTEPVVALWWFFLAAALIVTLVDVYLLLKVVRFCSHIRALTRLTLPAAAGIAKNTHADEALKRSVQLVGSLAGKTGRVQNLTNKVAQQLMRETR